VDRSSSLFLFGFGSSQAQGKISQFQQSGIAANDSIAIFPGPFAQQVYPGTVDNSFDFCLSLELLKLLCHDIRVTACGPTAEELAEKVTFQC